MLPQVQRCCCCCCCCCCSLTFVGSRVWSIVPTPSYAIGVSFSTFVNIITTAVLLCSVCHACVCGVCRVSSRVECFQLLFFVGSPWFCAGEAIFAGDLRRKRHNKKMHGHADKYDTRYLVQCLVESSRKSSKAIQSIFSSSNSSALFPKHVLSPPPKKKQAQFQAGLLLYWYVCYVRTCSSNMQTFHNVVILYPLHRFFCTRSCTRRGTL